MQINLVVSGERINNKSFTEVRGGQTFIWTRKGDEDVVIFSSSDLKTFQGGLTTLDLLHTCSPSMSNITRPTADIWSTIFRRGTMTCHACILNTFATTAMVATVFGGEKSRKLIELTHIRVSVCQVFIFFHRAVWSALACSCYTL